MHNTQIVAIDRCCRQVLSAVHRCMTVRNLPGIAVDFLSRPAVEHWIAQPSNHRMLGVRGRNRACSPFRHCRLGAGPPLACCDLEMGRFEACACADSSLVARDRSMPGRVPGPTATARPPTLMTSQRNWIKGHDDLRIMEIRKQSEVNERTRLISGAQPGYSRAPRKGTLFNAQMEA